MIFWNSELASASIEIIIILLWAFVLWAMFHWSLTPKSTWASIIEEGDDEPDDLQLIEWIWPMLEKYLNKSDIYSYRDLLTYDASGLRELLEKWWARYASHNPATWPDQARLAHDKKWSELEEYQEILGSIKKKKK